MNKMIFYGINYLNFIHLIKLITTKQERLIRMPYEQKDVSKATKIMFPIVITAITGILYKLKILKIQHVLFTKKGKVKYEKFG